MKLTLVSIYAALVTAILAFNVGKEEVVNCVRPNAHPFVFHANPIPNTPTLDHVSQAKENVRKAQELLRHELLIKQH